MPTRTTTTTNFTAIGFIYGQGRLLKWVDSVLAEHTSETPHEDLPDPELVSETTADIPPSIDPGVDPPPPLHGQPGTRTTLCDPDQFTLSIMDNDYCSGRASFGEGAVNVYNVLAIVL